MKKTVTILVALVYLVSFTGVSMRLHFCMGERAGWDFGKELSQICNKCGMKKKEKPDDGCCTDEYKFIKNTIDQTVKDYSVQLASLQSEVVPHSYFEISSLLLQANTQDYSILPAPLRSQGTGIYIRNCVFRI